MEASEEKSQLENDQKHLDLGFQSDLPDPSINDEQLVSVLTEELKKLVISCKDESIDRDFPADSVRSGDEDEVKRAIDEEVCDLVMNEAVNGAIRDESSSEVGEKKCRDIRVLMGEFLGRHGVKKVDPTECRVLEEGKGCENEAGRGKEVREIDDDDEKVDEHKEGENSKEIKIEDEHASVEVFGDEYNEEERDSENEAEFENGEEVEGGSMTATNDGRPKKYHYPLRPDAEDCSYYMRTGLCKFGSNCRFNHPIRRRNQQPSKETVKQKEENSERPAKIECKYYLSSGGCKYGKGCKYNHSRGRTPVTPVVEYNFLGLPIRPGEKECPYYMRNGSCKYGPNCRFNHPDPTAVGGDAPPAYGNDGSVPLHSASQPTMPTWSVPRTPNETAAFVPMMFSPTQSMPPPNPDWNGYQAPPPVPVPTPVPPPLYQPSERGLPIPPAFFLNNPPSDMNTYNHHLQQQQQMLVSDFPERPGQPECSYFMKTGDCKYRLSCKFHHPKSRISRPAPSVLSDKGLPLRPDQNICAHYSRYGICKYGPACKYDHPADYANSMSAGGGGYGPDGSGDASLIQQRL